MASQVKFLVLHRQRYCSTIIIGRLARQTFSGADQKIDDFSQAFKSLQDSLGRGIALQTGFVSGRILEGVETLGMALLN